MCTNKHKIFNKYTRRYMYVDCGHCPSCLQEKAAKRVSRINSQDKKGLDCLMVGLTYRRNDAPYVLREDAYKFSKGQIMSLPVYRDVSYRKVRQTASYDIGYKKSVETKVLCNLDYVSNVDFYHLKDLAHNHGKIGVCYYPDVQHFIARLRINLKRNYDFDEYFQVFLCSEYGAKSFRPHFHLLLWIPKGMSEIFRSAIIASWPFGNLQNFPRAIELAFRASSYVASYVNCGSDFPEFLRKYLPPKHSYSKGFGCNMECYSLPKILEKFNRGHLTLFVQKIVGNESRIIESVFPKYIIHRYFPKFKGYGRISPTSLLSYMQRVRECFKVSSSDSWRLANPTLYEYRDVGYLKLDSYQFKGSGAISYLSPSPVLDLDYLRLYTSSLRPLTYFSDEDFYKTAVRLDNAYYRFLENSGMIVSFADYCKLHIKVWNLYYSDCLRLFLSDNEIPINEKYDNLDEVLQSVNNGAPLPLGFTREMLKITNPNDFVTNKVRTGRMRDSYYEHLKHRSVNAVILSQQFEEM